MATAGLPSDDAPHELDLVAIDTARFEQVVEQPNHVARLSLDDVDLTARGVAALGLQERHGRNDRAEGVSQLVRQHG